MADETKGVVMGSAGLKPTALFAATREVFKNAGAMPHENKNTGVECRYCKENGVLQNPVVSTGSGLVCNMGHKFIDTDDLISHPHGTVPVAQHKATQENWVTVSFQLPSGTMQQLQAKYADPERMKATFASLVQCMVEPNMVIVSGDDLKRIGDAAGIPIRSSAEIYGIVSAQQQQINDLKEAATQTPQAASGGGTTLRRGELILWFDPKTTGTMTEKAAAAGVRLEDFLEKYINEANENSWF